MNRSRSATGFTTPEDMLAGRQQEIHAERKRKLDAGPVKNGRFVASKPLDLQIAPGWAWFCW
jgi:hypothetical protein